MTPNSLERAMSAIGTEGLFTPAARELFAEIICEATEMDWAPGEFVEHCQKLVASGELPAHEVQR